MNERGAGVSMAGKTGLRSCGCAKYTLDAAGTSEVINGVEHRWGKPCRPAKAKKPERANREGDQALPVVGQQSVFAEIRRRFDEREATGVKRYGRSLETFNGRDCFLDLEEELLDGVAYATQARLEHRAVVEALRALAQYVRDGRATGTVWEAVQLAEKLGGKLGARRV